MSKNQDGTTKILNTSFYFHFISWVAVDTIYYCISSNFHDYLIFDIFVIFFKSQIIEYKQKFYSVSFSIT